MCLSLQLHNQLQTRCEDRRWGNPPREAVQRESNLLQTEAKPAFPLTVHGFRTGRRLRPRSPDRYSEGSAYGTGSSRGASPSRPETVERQGRTRMRMISRPRNRGRGRSYSRGSNGSSHSRGSRSPGGRRRPAAALRGRSVRRNPMTSVSVYHVFHRSSRGSPERARDAAKRLHKTVAPLKSSMKDFLSSPTWRPGGEEPENKVRFNKYTDHSTFRVFTHMSHFSDKNNGLDHNGEPPRNYIKWPAKEDYACLH